MESNFIQNPPLDSMGLRNTYIVSKIRLRPKKFCK